MRRFSHTVSSISCPVWLFFPPKAPETFQNKTQLPSSKSHVYLLRVKLVAMQRNQQRSEPHPQQISIVPLKPIWSSTCEWIDQLFTALRNRKSEGLGSSTSGSAHSSLKAKKQKDTNKNRNNNKSAKFQCINSTQPSLGWSLEWE